MGSFESLGKFNTSVTVRGWGRLHGSCFYKLGICGAVGPLSSEGQWGPASQLFYSLPLCFPLSACRITVLTKGTFSDYIAFCWFALKQLPNHCPSPWQLGCSQFRRKDVIVFRIPDLQHRTISTARYADHMLTSICRGGMQGKCCCAC